jgi:hypothetical protein
LDLSCGVVWQQASELTQARRAAALEAAEGWSWAFGVPARALGTLAAAADPVTGELSLVTIYMLTMAALAAIFAALGLGGSGRVFGTVISEQNRISLSLVQVTAWTVLLMGGYTIYAAFNIGVMAETATRLGTAGDTLYPQFEGWAWAVMGIAIASPIASRVIKARKEDPAAPPPSGGLASTLDLRLKPLARNETAAKASLADLFFGEDQTNHQRLDITRTQHVIITALLLFTYGGWIAAAIGGLTPEQLLDAFPRALPILAEFPDPGGTFTGLLLLTHATYVAGKWQPNG